MQAWDMYLSKQDQQVRDSSGYGRRGAMGSNIALVVVDATYAFCGDRPEPILDSIKRFRNSSGERAWQAIGATETLLAAARLGSVTIIYTRGMGSSATISPGRWASKNCRAGEDEYWHDEIVEPIAPQSEDVVLLKTKPSGFFGTPLAAVLVERGIDSLVMCGGTTSGCVRATVVDAFSYNYAVSVVADACFDRFESSHALSLFDMDMKYADVIALDDAILTLNGGVPDPRQAAQRRRSD